MDFIIILLFLIIVLILLSIVYDINMRKIKQFAQLEETKLNELTTKYPSNIEICKYILNKLKNNKVKVEEDKNAETCLYIAITDKIVIANVKNSYTRIQTIAHECLHSIQNRKILLFNFIYSNFYIIYFFITTILTLFHKISHQMLILTIMIILSYIYYFIRSYLEMDAMTKAKFLAKEYMEEINLSSQEEIEKIIDSYDELNNVGIKATNFSLFSGTIIKVLVLTLACIIT